jgi:hypothetical protein
MRDHTDRGSVAAIARALEILRRDPSTVEICGRAGTPYRVRRAGAFAEIERDGETRTVRLAASS